MVKFILLAKRNKSMTREEFIDYYDNKHVPLIKKLFPEANRGLTRRNYIRHDEVLHPQEFDGEVEFDVVTESIWPDQDDLNKFLTATQNEEKMALLVADEEKLFERDSMRFVTVDTTENPIT